MTSREEGVLLSSWPLLLLLGATSWTDPWTLRLAILKISGYIQDAALRPARQGFVVTNGGRAGWLPGRGLDFSAPRSRMYLFSTSLNVMADDVLFFSDNTYAGAPGYRLIKFYR